MSPEALSELISSIAHNLVAAGQAGALTDELIPPVDKLAVMRPKDRAHGDWASNIAMQLAKKAGMKPRDLAEPFAARYFEAVDWIWANKTYHMADALLNGLYPGYADPATLVKLGDAWLDEHIAADNALKRLIVENVASSHRTLKVREYNEAL